MPAHILWNQAGQKSLSKLFIENLPVIVSYQLYEQGSYIVCSVINDHKRSLVSPLLQVHAEGEGLGKGHPLSLTKRYSYYPVWPNTIMVQNGIQLVIVSTREKPQKVCAGLCIG